MILLLLVLPLAVALASGKSSQYPNSETTRYLGELLRRNEPGITDTGVHIAQSFMPIELLFDEEVLRPRIGAAATRAAQVTFIIQIPESCPYAAKLKRRDSPPNHHYTVLPSENIRGYAIIHESKPRDGDNATTVLKTVEAIFHEQTDLDNNGKWDRDTCWEIVKTTCTKPCPFPARHAIPEHSSE